MTKPPAEGCQRRDPDDNQNCPTKAGGHRANGPALTMKERSLHGTWQ